MTQSTNAKIEIDFGNNRIAVVGFTQFDANDEVFSIEISDKMSLNIGEMKRMVAAMEEILIMAGEKSKYPDSSQSILARNIPGTISVASSW